MLVVLNRFFNWLMSLFWSKEMEMTIIGLSNSGKTTFVNILTGEEFHEQTIATIGFSTRKIRKRNVQMKIWDVGGQERFRSMWERYCRGVNVIVFMIDAADHGRLDEAKEELSILLSKPQLKSIPLLVLGNKNDLPGALDEWQLIQKLNLPDINERELCYYSISCKNNKNILVTLEWLIEHSSRVKKYVDS